MQQKSYKLSSGKEVHVFDDVLPLKSRIDIFGNCLSSPFHLGWEDSEYASAKKHRYFHSVWSIETVNDVGILKDIAKTPLFEYIKNWDFNNCIVNASLPCYSYFPHTHTLPEKKILLYYPNIVWEDHWHAETVFYTDDLKEIELSIKYTPGRFIIFDADSPHALRPPSNSAEDIRFTIAFIFK